MHRGSSLFDGLFAYPAQIREAPEELRSLRERSQKLRTRVFKAKTQAKAESARKKYDLHVAKALTCAGLEAQADRVSASQAARTSGESRRAIGFDGVDPSTGRTVLHAELDEWSEAKRGAKKEHEDYLIAMLIAGAAADVPDREGGVTPLLLATAKGATTVVRALLVSGADHMTRSKRGFTPLLYLAHLPKTTAHQERWGTSASARGTMKKMPRGR